MTIDTLSIKFEGIVRDIVRTITGVTTKIDKHGNSLELLLDDLLRSEAVEQTFNKNDINLFQYTFTTKGYNIRNNVAHGFYKPFDYTIEKVILTFLCVLRLAKFYAVRDTTSKAL